jgi:Mlc titration factor MtfA (ptsG expression regulator)
MRNAFLKYWYQSKRVQPSIKWENILLKYSSYYKGLDSELKKRFLQRVYVNLKIKDFIPVRFPKVTEEMKVLITSALVEITFGMKEYTFSKFDKIYVIPNMYNFVNMENLLGHVDMKARVICLSWPSVQEGFIIPDDAMNVALHEMAHALMEENRFRMLGFRFFSSDHINHWGKEAYDKLLMIQAGTSLILNSYGGRNMLEMFAVCMETFFEKPNEFKTELPELYQAMSKLLNQDPTITQYPILHSKNNWS